MAYELRMDIFPVLSEYVFPTYPTVLISLTVYKKRQDYRDSSSRMVNIVFQGGVRYMTAIISAITLSSI